MAKIWIIDELETSDHIQIMMKIQNPSLEHPASSKVLSPELQSGTSNKLQSPKSGLKEHGSFLNLIYQDRKKIF